MTKITAIEGIGSQNASKLADVGITTVEGLLKKCADKKGRQEVAAASGVEAKRLLGWTNRADLFRIKGISAQYSDLLEAAGVDTVPELAQRNSANLQKKMAEVNVDKKLVRQVPTEKQVTSWVAQAKELPRIITY